MIVLSDCDAGLWTQVWCTQERSKRVIGVVCLSAFIFTLPSFLEFTAKETTQLVNGHNKTEVTAVETPVASTVALRVAYPHLTQTLFTFIPFVQLATFNSLLVSGACQSPANTACGDIKLSY
jgi:hypothetical protein